MENYIVVIGTSAGGLESLKSLLGAIPPEFSAPILIVMHTSSNSISHLAEILQRNSHLTITTASNEQKMEKGTVYIAPSNNHMVVEEGLLRLEHGPKINHCRPAIDPLFYSVAFHYGSCAIGIILSGLLDDGSAGLLAIKRNHGIAIVQDLDEAPYPDMPSNALRNAKADYCLPTVEIAELLIQLVKKPLPDEGCIRANSQFNDEIKMNLTKYGIPEEEMNKIGSPSVFACPECHGVLWELKDDEMLRFRCRVGHALSSESLVEVLNEGVEAALWEALRVLEEKQNLLKRIGERISESEGNEYYKSKAKDYDQSIGVLRSLLINNRK